MAMVKKITKKEIQINGKEKIRKLLKSNNEFLNKAILFLYQFQTEDEKYFNRTEYENFEGFNKPDAYVLSAYVNNLFFDNLISRNDIEDARNRMLKYTGQLFNSDIDTKDYKIMYSELKRLRDEKLKSETMTMEDLKNLDWSKPKNITTRDGKKLILKSCVNFPQKNFWNFWKQKKNHIKLLGISPKKDTYNGTGNWVLNWWINDLSEVVEVVQEKKVDLTPLKNPDKLFGYQREHTQKIIQSLINNKVALDSSDTGTGKTYSSLSACYELGLKPLVICPKAVIPSWEKALKHFGMEALTVVNYELIKTGKMIHKRPKKRGIGYVKENINCPYLDVKKNPNIRSRYDPKYILTWDLPSDGIIIFDEAHRGKNRNTINTKLFIEAKNQGLRILMLSATIAENPLKLFSVGYALNFYERPHYFYSWVENYGCYKKCVNMKTGAMAWIFDGNIRHIQKLHNELFPKFGSRMRISMIPEFPESQIEAQIYDMNSNARKIQKIYIEMAKELEELRKKKEGKAKTPLTVRQESRQQVELLKIPTLVELTNDYIESGNSVVLFVNYTQTLIALVEKLKTNCTIYGGNNGRVNEENRAKFQNDESRIIICNVQASREGIDLHDINGKYPRVALLSPSDSAQNLKQCLGRVHRIGGKSKSIQRIIYCANTIEEKVCENVRYKIENISMLNDGNLDLNADIF